MGVKTRRDLNESASPRSGRKIITAVQDNHFFLVRPLQGKALGQEESVKEKEVLVS